MRVTGCGEETDPTRGDKGLQAVVLPWCFLAGSDPFTFLYVAVSAVGHWSPKLGQPNLLPAKLWAGAKVQRTQEIAVHPVSLREETGTGAGGPSGDLTPNIAVNSTPGWRALNLHLQPGPLS